MADVDAPQQQLDEALPPAVGAPAPAPAPVELAAAEEEQVGDRPLLPRHQRFVEEYLVDLNGFQAVIRAGYSANGAEVQAHRLLNNVRIAAAIETAKAQRATRVGVTQESVLTEMSLLANSSIEHYFVDELGNLKATPDAPAGAMRAVQSVKKTTRFDKEGNLTIVVEFKLWDKPGPLKLMGRHTGLFPDKVEVTGAGGGPIETVTKVERVIIDPKVNG